MCKYCEGNKPTPIYDGEDLDDSCIFILNNKMHVITWNYEDSGMRGRKLNG